MKGKVVRDRQLEEQERLVFSTDACQKYKYIRPKIGSDLKVILKEEGAPSFYTMEEEIAWWRNYFQKQVEGKQAEPVPFKVLRARVEKLFGLPPGTLVPALLRDDERRILEGADKIFEGREEEGDKIALRCDRGGKRDGAEFLTVRDVHQIRDLHDIGWSYLRLAEKFNTTRWIIARVVGTVRGEAEILAKTAQESEDVIDEQAIEEDSLRLESVIQRHRDAWPVVDAIRRMAQERGDEKLLNFAKKNAEVLMLIQKGERASWGVVLDGEEELLGGKRGNNVQINYYSNVPTPDWAQLTHSQKMEADHERLVERCKGVIEINQEYDQTLPILEGRV